MTHASYKQFCPLAKASEILCTRWTLILVREMLGGAVRFNDLRRGVPAMSPTLLSQRLKELTEAGIVERRPVSTERGAFEYHLTAAGRDVAIVLDALGNWGQKWVASEASLEECDASLLMREIRRNLNPASLPARLTVIEFEFTDAPLTERRWWLLVSPNGNVDLRWNDRGFDVDACIKTDLRTMTSVWMGLTTIEQARERIKLRGPTNIIESMQVWLGLSPFAGIGKMVA